MARSSLHFGRYDYAAFSAFTTYSICSLAIPLMIVSIGKSLNFPMDDGGMAAGGVLHLVRSITMLIALVACGFLAGWTGKRRIMGASLILIGAGIMCCALAQAYWVLIPCLLFAGFGEGICEGILTPFVQDLHPKSPERYVNIAHSFWSVGICLVVVLAGGLLTLGMSWRVVLFAMGLLTLLASMLFLWKEKAGKKYPESSQKQNVGEIVEKTGAIFRVPHFWVCCLAMFFGAGAEFGLTFWAAAYIELTFKTSAWVAGLGTGMIALGMFAGRTTFGYFAKPGNLRKILLASGLGTIPITLVLAVLERGSMPDGLLFVLLFFCLFLAGIGIAPFWPSTQVFGVNSMPQLDSTLLYVYFSGVGIPGCGAFAWLMGFMGDHFGLKGAILVVPVCLLIFSVITWYSCWISNPAERKKK